MEYQEAFKIVKDTIQADKGLYNAWQSHLAMAFHDAFLKRGYRVPDLSEISNEAATSFIEDLLRPVKV